MFKQVVGVLVLALSWSSVVNANPKVDPYVSCSQDVYNEYGKQLAIPAHVGDADMDFVVGTKSRLGGFWDSESKFRTIHFELVTSNTVRVQLQSESNTNVKEGFIDLNGKSPVNFVYDAIGGIDHHAFQVTVSCKLIR